MPQKAIREFFRLEAAGGILLAFAALLALVADNSFLKPIYDSILTTPVKVQIGAFILDKPLLLWINDGLMAIFFLLIGLEIKREMLQGQFSSKEQIVLPSFAAFGGLALPALIYYSINMADPEAVRGWAIPAATDIAFALGVVTLLGKRVPEALKVTLVAIAILDDIAAILIIALFYTDNISLASLGIASAAIAVLALLNRRGVASITPYMLVGIVLWAAVLKSGVHATLAGVVLAFFIPMKAIDNKGQEYSPVKRLEHSLHPSVAFAILPIFAFANAGVSLEGLSIDLLMEPITLGIIAGLFFGKQIGVMVMSALAVSLKLCTLPKDVNWLQYYGMALITGVGFTMSLFIGTLAFIDQDHQTAVRLGVIVGSLLSGVAGYLVLKFATKKQKSTA